MLGMSEKEWALIQSHPVYKKIQEDSPLRNNAEFVYSTNSREHAQAMWDKPKVQKQTDSEKVETEIQSVQSTFDNSTTLSSEIPVESSVERLYTESTEVPIYEVKSEKLIDLNQDTFTLYELLKMPETEIPFVVENLIPESSITFLSGDSDGGKTSIYQQLCLSIIQGNTEFLGLKLRAKNKSALIINSEDSPLSIKVRLVKQLAGIKLSPEESKRLTVMTLSKETETKIESHLKKNPVDLVVIDAFSDVYDGDTRSDNAARIFMNKFIVLIQKYGCTILFIHHIGKGKESAGPNKDSMLGTVAIHGKARSVLMLTKEKSHPKIKSLKIVKGNYVSEDQKNQVMFLEFDPVTLLHKVVSDKSLKEEIAMQHQQSENLPSKRSRKTDVLKLQAVKLRQDGMTLQEIGEIVNRDKATVCKWLKNPPVEYDVSKVVRKAS
jgi:archaellum biogenesis ATPase FlaH